MFREKGALRNFTKFKGKHLCQSLFFNKVAGYAWNFMKKETGTGVFLWILWNPKNTFLNITPMLADFAKNETHSGCYFIAVF